MSIKKLFESANKVQDFVSQTDAKSAFNEDAESLENVELKTTDQQRYVPQVNYADPENFAKYGSARLYYKSALSRITGYYPYDGSEDEKNKFLNGCIDLERYILKNRYPMTQMSTRLCIRSLTIQLGLGNFLFHCFRTTRISNSNYE